MNAFNDAGYFNRSRLREQFTRMRFRGQWLRVWATAIGTRRDLVSLAEVESTVSVHGRRHAGIQSIALAAIVGSEGRSTDFDRDFRPLRTHSQDRWMRIALAKENDELLPVIDLVQIGGFYFVLDGHHRLSVAGLFGQREIEAAVTVWETDLCHEELQTLVQGVSRVEAVLTMTKQIMTNCLDFVHRIGGIFRGGISGSGISGSGISGGELSGGLSGGISGSAGTPAMQGG